MKTKICACCKKSKNVSDFHKHSCRKDGLRIYCKVCYKEKYNSKRTLAYNSEACKKSRKKSQGENLVKYRHICNMKRVSYMYKLSESQLQNLLLEQQGLCKICLTDFGSPLEKRHPNGRQYHIDHDHKTGQVRGLLCGSCNIALGYLEKTKADLQRVSAYLLGTL